MKFISIQLNNWLVFRGQQKVSFPQDDHANILLIFGENMHGKTSLLNAVRWGLYGEALDRQKRIIQDNKLLNIDAAANGETTFGVTLTIESQGKLYEIQRNAEVSGTSIQKSLILREDNRVQDGGDVSDAKIEGLVPKQISQFLLFDGELLNEFEQLVVDEGGPQASAIKSNIEKALGLPVLQRAKEELSSLQKSTSKAFQEEMKKNRLIELLIRNLEKHESDLASKFEEMATVENEIKTSHIRVSELDQILDQSQKDVALSEKRKLLKDELIQNKKDITALEQDLKVLMSQIWRLPLNLALAPHIKQLETSIRDLKLQRRLAESSIDHIKDLQKALIDSTCGQCGNHLSSEQIVTLNTKIDKLTESTQDPRILDQEVSSLNKTLDGIKFEENNFPTIFELQTKTADRARLLRRNVKIEDDIFEIRNTLNDFDEESSRKTKAEYDMRMKEIGRQTENLISIKSTIDKIQFEISMIKKNPDYRNAVKNDSNQTRVETCENLLTIFSQAISSYRDTMRAKVGQRASDTFGHLTTELNFDRLQINDSYGLNLIIEGKQVARSAGAEQIVALSLIEALNHHGRTKGPMLMDTPAGRLDKEHRKNIMEYLPTVATQLAFFAHSGELSEADIYFDRSRIGKKYKISKIRPFHSLLEEI